MSQREDNLGKALSENGAFDPGKAKESREKVVSSFEAKMRKVERYLWAYMCLCCWLLVFALFHFFHSSTTKAMIFYGLLVLIFFETTILMKLWYWIANNKLTVLKEVKQLRLGGLADDSDDSSWPADRPRGSVPGLSRWERRVWWVVLIGGAAIVGAVKSESDTYWNPGAGATLTSDGCVTLAADGSGSTVTEMSFVYQAIEPRTSLSFYAPKETVLRFTDSRGRELPFTTSPQNGHVRYDIDLDRIVWPGQRFSYTRTQESPKCATREGNLWTYSTDYSYGYGTNEFAETVVLPEGAEIVSVDPWPVAKFTLTGRPTLRFEGTRGRNELFKYTVQYRLPPDPNGSSAE